MNLNEIASALALRHLTPESPGPAPDISLGHSSDMLSDVLANAPTGGLLITIQTHMNVLAVAVHAGLAAIIFASGRTPEEDVRRKALQEGIRLYASERRTFDIVGQLYAMGLRGR